MPTENIASKSDFETFLGSATITVVHFFAPWADQCQKIDDIIDELAKQPENEHVKFGKCEAEELAEISQQYRVAAVPTVIVFVNGKVSETINGANPANLVFALKKLTKEAETKSIPLEDRLKSLTNKSSIMIFMKGDPQQPRCGFSRTLVGILNETGVAYDTFDILQDEEVRQGLKTFSNWPTYPQIYVKGELVGGLDIIQELKQGGELMSTLQPN